MSSDGTDYPNSEPDGLGDLHEIRRLEGMSKHAPAIKWGHEYQEWPVEKRLSYAERLAASMNHAADILQQERDKLIGIANAQEVKIKSLQASYDQQSQIVQHEIGDSNAQQQELNELIVSLQKELKQKTRRIEKLEAASGHND